MKKMLALGLVAVAVNGYAADKTVLLEVPVSYHADAGVVPKVKDECKPEAQLATHVGAMLKKLNGSGDGTVASADAAGDASVLRLQITHVLGVGGGGMSGPKAITVNAELLEGGKVVRQTKVNRWSTGGMFGAMRGTCSILDSCAAAIGKDLGKWVNNPSFQIKEEAAPKNAEPEKQAAAQ
ncbi:hypothetical protein [Jeongeupia chitinilytica]|uniref:DUF4410 domain-containing protein n=1 Tax=Jeongeupia chitinilytica TaxID=1041641 RepID=A0ABQ3H1C4_9NEIS|nr:hypothetical protein [Jeongeupia chitinilytica]GHD62319.1 hypothetical protein GCM10007350_18090 [Jeongeupia chitinilytica]